MGKNLSVIVPVFNVAQYLSEFLGSLIKATSPEDEILLINDGSTDGSLSILRDYSRNNSQITIVNQPNAGVSAARNHGLRMAQGKWVAFADPDDWVGETYYERAIDQAVRTGAEMVMSNAMYCHERSGNQTPVYSVDQYLPQGFMTGEEALAHCLKRKHLPHMVWMHLYQKKFLDRSNMSFLSATDGNEDVLWTFKALLLANRVSFVKEAGYYYRVISGRKRTDSYYSHKIQAAVLNARGIVNLCGEYLNKFPDVKESLNYHIVDGALSIFHHLEKLKSRCFKRETRIRLRKEKFFRFIFLRTSSWKLRKRIMKQWLFSLL